jgi:hypothetical protein
MCVEYKNGAQDSNFPRPLRWRLHAHLAARSFPRGSLFDAIVRLQNARDTWRAERPIGGTLNS